MTALTKVSCRRCKGSGRYSFNLLRGTVCFGCEGTGVQMVDLAREQAKKTATEKRRTAQQEKRELVMAASAAVLAEMNGMFGSLYDIETELGIDQLNKAVAGKFGRSIWVIRDERLAAEPDTGGSDAGTKRLDNVEMVSGGDPA